MDVNEKLLRQGDPKEVCSDPKKFLKMSLIGSVITPFMI